MRNREPLRRAVIRKGRRQRPFNIAVALRARRCRWVRRPCCENMEGGFHYHKRCDGCSVSCTYDQKDSLLREPHTLFAQRVRPLRHRHTCLPDLIRRGGRTAACAPPPVSLSAQAPDEGPPQLHIGVSRRQPALAAAISPGSLPQVWELRQGPTTTTADQPRRKIVSTQTYVCRAYLRVLV